MLQERRQGSSQKLGPREARAGQRAGRLAGNRSALGSGRAMAPLALPHTRSYGGCRSEGGSNTHASVFDRRPVPRTGRRVRRRIHPPGPRPRNHRDAIALVEHGALDCDCPWGRPSCAGGDLPPATDGFLTGTNSTPMRGRAPQSLPTRGSPCWNPCEGVPATHLYPARVSD